jgi:head-tail adaptor
MLGSRLKHPIEIFQEVKTKDSIGSSSITEQLVASVKADIKVDVGRAVGKEDTIITQTEAIFYIRNYPEMRYSYYIKYQGEKYSITAIQPFLDGSGQTIKTVRNG